LPARFSSAERIPHIHAESVRNTNADTYSYANRFSATYSYTKRYSDTETQTHTSPSPVSAVVGAASLVSRRTPTLLFTSQHGDAAPWLQHRWRSLQPPRCDEAPRRSCIQSTATPAAAGRLYRGYNVTHHGKSVDSRSRMNPKSLAHPKFDP